MVFFFTNFLLYYWCMKRKLGQAVSENVSNMELNAKKVSAVASSWSCKFCTLQNGIAVDKCAACNEWRYSYGPPVSTIAPYGRCWDAMNRFLCLYIYQELWMHFVRSEILIELITDNRSYIYQVINSLPSNFLRETNHYSSKLYMKVINSFIHILIMLKDHFLRSIPEM